MKRVAIAVLMLLALTGFEAAAERLSYVDLIWELTDLDALAELPPEGEKCSQWSSYNRTSKYDETTGKYIEWDFNADGGGFIRKEGPARVLAEMEGPGCIRRIWSARPEAGHIKIYLDGAAEPAIDMPFKGMFDGVTAPFNYPSLAYDSGKGKNCFVPIPYQKSCKIVVDEGWGKYYHFTYTTFPAGADVPTFSTDLTDEEKDALKQVDEFLAQRLGKNPTIWPGKETMTKVVELRAEEKVEVAQIAGPRAVTALKIKMDASLPWLDSVSLMRELVLQITWDNDSKPAVWSPLGDFFGTAPGMNMYKSLPVGMTEDGLYSYWYMPFEKNAIIELINEGETDCSMEVVIEHAALEHPISNLGRFHAKWHRDVLMPEEPERAIDWTMIKTEGRGRYCGVMLHVWNPEGGWWGEGDEKFFVDGEKFPSTFGTGSEDYFGYAWCNPELFHRPFNNQTFNWLKNYGHVSVNRWQIADNIPFQTAFEGAIEKYYKNDRPTLYAATAYWYLEPGGKDWYEPVELSERVDYYDSVVPSVTRYTATFTADTINTKNWTGGRAFKTSPRHLARGKGWTYVLWKDAKAGDTLDLELLPLEDAGSYQIEMQFTKGPGFGKVEVYLNGEKIGDVVNLKAEELEQSDVINFGRRDLSKGIHRLTFKMTDDSEGERAFGLSNVALRHLPPRAHYKRPARVTRPPKQRK
ncbi:glycoside hydrolase family 172 protein [Candidatus Hydrogenedentota bacterium]